MTERRRTVSGGRGARSRLDPLDWDRVARAATPGSLLAILAEWIGRPVVLRLEDAGGGGGEIARCAPGEPAALAEGSLRTVDLGGSPPWRLRIGPGRGSRLAPTVPGMVGAAVAAWRAFRAEIEVQGSRVRRGTAELEVLQLLGSAVAEAPSPERLFATTARVLAETACIAPIVAADGTGEEGRIRAYLAAPVAAGALRKLAAQAWNALNAESGNLPEVETVRLDSYDDSLPEGDPAHDGIVRTLPLKRRGRVEAVLAAVLPVEQKRGSERLLFAAANQVSLHLDRILTAREAERDRFRAILQSMPQAVLLTDPALRPVLANPSAAELLARIGHPGQGLPLEHLGGLDLRVLGFRALGAGPEPPSAEAELEDGSVVHVTVSRVEGPDGVPEGLLLVVSDVTESRRLQRQMARTERLSSLGQMISGIAHELNNPLSSVVGYAQLVEAGDTDPELARRLGTIRREAERCRKIVHNLLSLARRHEPEHRPLSLNEVVSSVTSFMGYPLRAEGIRLEAEFDPAVPVVRGDPHQLRQAVINLVTNAHHALKERGRGGTVIVRTHAGEHGEAVLEVQDDGPGVPERVRTRIFDPFFTTKSEGVGTGLGLALVQGIASSHGGAVELVDDPAPGARFRITLPPCGETPETAARDETVPGDSGPAGRVLVVDDEEDVLRFLSEALEADGHRVCTARDGDEALRRLREATFDVILSDLRMPGMDGGELYRRMGRLDPTLPDRMILTTGDTLNPEPEAFARRRNLPLLHKPFDLGLLRRAVRERLKGGGGS